MFTKNGLITSRFGFYEKMIINVTKVDYVPTIQKNNCVKTVDSLLSWFCYNEIFYTLRITLRINLLLFNVMA